MKKIVGRVLVTIFVLVAVFVTANVLSYNDYEVAEFGKKSLVLANKHMEKYGYKNGDLIITTKAEDNIKNGDTIIYYNVYQKNVTIDQGKVEEISSNGKQFYLDSNTSIQADRVLGKTSNVKTIHGIGSVLKVLESRIGYLLIILLPTVAIFAVLIRKVIVELKEEKKN
jgi:hypothetical protein